MTTTDYFIYIAVLSAFAMSSLLIAYFVGKSIDKETESKKTSGR